MSTLTSLISAGGGGGTQVNQIAQWYVGPETLYEDPTGGVWLKTGNYITRDSVTYPDAFYESDLSVASFVHSTSAGDSFPQGVTFNNDGTAMYVVGSGSDAVDQFSLSTAFDISTSVSNGAIGINGQSTVPTGIAFNNDGSKMYISSTTPTSTFTYNLSTPFDVTTAVYASSTSGTSNSITFNNDGSKYYRTVGGYIYEYSLSTPYDLSTGTYIGAVELTVDGTVADLIFNGDGSKMYALISNLDNIYVYNLSTLFSVFSAGSVYQTLNVNSKESSPLGIALNNDGTKIYVTGNSSDLVHEYNVPEIMGLTVDTGDYDYLKLK